jgi:hypothetical protein
MKAPGTLGPVALALALGFLGAAACQARSDEFFAKVFPCKSNAGDTCGTTRAGRPMTCFPASKLGGDDFCAEACDPSQGSADPRFVCTSSGALLQTCGPDRGATDPTYSCPSGLACYRTDLLSDSGLCLQMPVCSQDSDCNADRNVCASTLLRQRTSLPLAPDHLQCIVTMCGFGNSQCPPGEGCLAGYYEAGYDYDICVPTCDQNRLCPPNFACASGPAPSGSPLLCLPGVPGIRCQSDQDCVAGECVDTGAGFNECVLTKLACETDLDCAILNGASSTFLCVEGVPGAGRRCILKEEFAGTNCSNVTDCPLGFICTYLSPYEPVMNHGECRLACGMDLGCPARGGIPHVCIEGGAGGCYPTSFGLPCASSADCMPELACLPALPDAHTVIDSPTICTMPCTTDADCTSNPLIRSGAFCRQDEHLCRQAGFPGVPCVNDDQCLTGVCVNDGKDTGTCN